MKSYGTKVSIVVNWTGEKFMSIRDLREVLYEDLNIVSDDKTKKYIRGLIDRLKEI